VFSSAACSAWRTPNAVLVAPPGAGKTTSGSFSYIDPDHFKAVYVNPKEPDAPLGLVLERQGIFTWKLIRLDIPFDEIAKDAERRKHLKDADGKQSSGTQSDP
jgi:hypothetical protein